MVTARPSSKAVLPPRLAANTIVNDVHSVLNPTRVGSVATPCDAAGVAAELSGAARSGRRVAVCGGRHAMGGQQFASGALLLDTSALVGVHDFDPGRGTIRLGAGMRWPEVLHAIHAAQPEGARWSIRQKQTGADRISLGGTLAANAHGRGLDMQPFVADVEAFTLVTPDARTLRCSRAEHTDLFALVAGGYGVFGVVTDLTLRLAPRTKLRRRVIETTADQLHQRFDERRRQGCIYGDFQFVIDAASPDFLHRGVFSCYEPVDDATPMPAAQHKLGRDDWMRLLSLAHTDKPRAYRQYLAHYLATDGQLYWSDTHQCAEYVEAYHAELDGMIPACPHGTEMISELYVPRERLASFLATSAAWLRERNADVIYGTIRLIRAESDSFLAWARQDWACVVLNLHVPHTGAGIADAGATFRGLIDSAIGEGGTFYLTYHRWATGEQVRDAHPRIGEFLARQQRHDPRGVMGSDWLDHARANWR